MLHSAPADLFMVGDLAHQMLCQGREGFANCWCAFCEWGKKNWEMVGERKVGKAWMHESMEELLAKVKPNKKKHAAQQRKGLTNKKPLFDAIPLENFLPPPLHSVDLFVDGIKDLFDAFVDHGLKNRPVELLRIRWDAVDGLLEEREAWNELQDAEFQALATQELGDGILTQEAEANLVEAATKHKTAKDVLATAKAEAVKMVKRRSMEPQARPCVSKLMVSWQISLTFFDRPVMAGTWKETTAAN